MSIFHNLHFVQGNNEYDYYPQVDDTLSVRGRAADAAITGEKIEGVNNRITLVQNALVEKESVNLVNLDTITENAQLYPSGNTIPSDDKSITDYIKVKQGETLYFYCDASSGVFYPANVRILVFFDTNKTSIAYEISVNQYDVPSDGYVRVEFYNNKKDSFEVSKSPQTHYSAWSETEYETVDHEARNDIAKLEPAYSLLTKTTNEIKDEIHRGFSYERLVLPDDFSGEYNPLAIYYNRNDIKTDYEASNFSINGTPVYCSPNGDASADGTDPQRPTTLNHIKSSVGGKKVILSQGIHYISDVLGQSNTNFEIIGDPLSSTFIIVGQLHEFEQSNGYWTTQASGVKVLYDITSELELYQVESIAELVPHSYCFVNGTITLNVPFDPNGRIVVIEPTENRAVLAYATTVNNRVFLKDVIILGGKQAVFAYGDASHIPEVICDNVKAKYANEGISATYSNVLLYKSRFERMFGDAITYAHSNYVEIDSIGANCTETSTHTTNGSTGHTYSKGIRAGSKFFNNEGANIADTTYCESVCICCDGSYSCAKDRTAQSNGHATGFIVEDHSVMWLINCKAKGNALDLSVSGASSTIYAKNCEYDTANGITVVD